MPPRVPRRSASQNASNSSENAENPERSNGSSGALQLDLDNEVVEANLSLSPTRTVGSASPAVVHSPARMNIANEHTLVAKIREAQQKRDKLSDVTLKEMEDDEIKLSKFLDLIRAYEAVDNELDLLRDSGKYTPEDVEFQRLENSRKRNEERGTANDKIWKSFIAANVENHRMLDCIF